MSNAVRNQIKLTSIVDVRAFGAKGDGVTNDTAAIQAAIDSINTGVVHLPRGVYLVSATLLTKSGVIIQGDGDASELRVNTDIEVFASANTTANTAIFQAEFRKFFINKTVSGATTKYDIHLYNPNICHFEQVHIKSGHVDNQYSETNVGGIWLDKPTGSTATCFMNRLENCWLQNNSIYFRGVTDSTIVGGFVWGHTRQFAIRLQGGGNINVESIEGILCSKFNGGIWIDGANFTMARIQGNLFDGGVATVDNGSAIYAPALSYAVTVSNNIIWSCSKHGIDLTDPAGWVISNNVFYKGNRADTSQDDLRITGATFSPARNIVANNTFFNDEARTNKGYAIREVNAGFAPVGNVYTGNAVSASTAYPATTFLLLGLRTQSGNAGLGVESSLRLLNGAMQLDYANTINAATNAVVGANGTLDLTLNTDAYFGNPGGFAGTLSVSSTRTNFAQQSRRTVYAVVGRGTTATFTSLASQDGSGGGSTFTVTMGANGVVRFTDTSAQEVDVRMHFVGTRSLA